MKKHIIISGVILLILFNYSCKTEDVPVISTTVISEITGTTAISGGNITDEGSSPVISRGVCWSTSVKPTLDLVTKTNDGSGTGTYSSNLTGLNRGTTYYLRAYATNSEGTGYGNELDFKTSGNIYLYQIEMTKDLRLSRVKEFMDNELISDKVYMYSDKEVKIYETNSNTTTTYILNSSGLADSSFSSSYTGTTYYNYDDNGYLISYGAKDYLFHCSYENGNRTDVIAVQYRCQSGYNFVKNIIDLESFTGLYLGKLNTNLIQTKHCSFTMANDSYSTVYEYLLNSEGLVIQRIERNTHLTNVQAPYTIISTFEYVVVD
jgi:hypothetical protein